MSKNIARHSFDIYSYRTTSASEAYYNAGAKWQFNSGGDGTLAVCNDIVSNVGDAGFSILNNTSGNRDVCQKGIPYTYGETYTLSVYCRKNTIATNDPYLMLRSWNTTTNVQNVVKTFKITSTEWTRYSYTFVCNWETGIDNSSIAVGITGAGSLDFCGVKFEQGSVATDWSPAPEDNYTGWTYDILALCDTNVFHVVDVKACYRFYLLQSSTMSPPAKPTSITPLPPSPWSDTEPAYVEGSTNSLYTVDLTIYSDDTFDYSDVSLSSSYEAAKQAYNIAKATQEAIEPIDSKTYTNLIGTANNFEGANFFFAKIHPTNYTVNWRVKLKFTVTVPEAYAQVVDVTFGGYGSTFSSFDAYTTRTGSIGFCYVELLRATTTGINTNHVGHMLGLALHSSSNPTNTSYKRTIRVDLLEVYNCEVVMNDTAVHYSNMSGYNTTNYNTSTTNLTQMAVATAGQNATNNSDTRDNIITYFTGKTGARGIWATSLFMRDEYGTYQNICTASDGTATSSNRTQAATKKANPSGFEIGSPLWYTTVSYNPNTSITGANQIYSSYAQVFDSRWAFNTTLSNGASPLTAYQNVYLVGTIGVDGLFYLDSVWWTQTPNDSDKVYVLVGGCYDCTTSNVRIVLYEQNKWYKYVNGELVDYTNRLAELAQATADSKAEVFYSDTAPTGSNYNEFDVWFDTSANGGNAMYYWNGTTWVLKQFDTGALREGCVTADLIDANAVTADKILAGCITGTKIAGSTITGTNIAGSTITADKMSVTDLSSINANLGTITAGTIKSTTYAEKSTPDQYTSSGMMIDLSTTGKIKAKNFAIDNSGNAYFNGTVYASAGKIGGSSGFTIDSNKIYSSTHSAYNTAVAGVYIGTDYISLGSGGVTYFKSDGTGKLGAWSFDSTKIYNGTYGANSSVYLSTADMGSKTIGDRTGSDWRVTVGSRFGITNTGALYCSDISSYDVCTLKTVKLDMTGGISTSDDQALLSYSTTAITLGDQVKTIVLYGDTQIDGTLRTNGNVHINKSDDNYQLRFRMTNSIRAGAVQLDSDGNFGLYNITNDRFFLYDDGSKVMAPYGFRLANNVFINATSSSNAMIRMVGLTNNDYMYVGGSSSSALPARTYIGQKIGNTYIMNASGSWVTLTTAVSDRRLKHDIGDITMAKELIMGLKPQSFKLNGEEEDRQHFGFIAQDVRPLMEKTVGDSVLINYNPSEENEIYDKNDESTFEYSMDYDQFIAPHIAVTQEHEREIAELKAEIKELKAIIKNMK